MALPTFTFTRARTVVTGAASGMGEQLAHQLAGLGAELILVDRDEARLAAVAADVGRSASAASVATHVVDLADPAAIARFVDEVTRTHDRVDLLVNNAGVALGGDFRSLSADEFDWLLAVNFRAPVALIRGLLPLMGTGGHIVNLSSLFGLVAPAGQSAYVASKFALRGFSESLRRELVPDGIGVTTVHPGGVRTRIAESARMAATLSSDDAQRGRAQANRLLTYPADRAAAEIVDGVRHRRARVVITPEAKLLDLAARLFPEHNLEIVQGLQRRAKSLQRRR